MAVSQTEPSALSVAHGHANFVRAALNAACQCHAHAQGSPCPKSQKRFHSRHSRAGVLGQSAPAWRNHPLTKGNRVGQY